MAQSQRDAHGREAHPAEETDDEKKARAAAEEKAIRDEAEAKTAGLPTPGSAPVGKIDGKMYADAHGEGTVKMLIPEAFSLTLDDLSMISFESGVQEVPASVAQHPYLKAQGVKPV